MANVGPVARMNPEMLRPRPGPLEGHAASLPGAFQRTVIRVNLVVLQQVLVRAELLPTALDGADVALMQGQLLSGVEARRTAIDAACVLFDVHWRISWRHLLSCGFFQLDLCFCSGSVLTWIGLKLNVEPHRRTVGSVRVLPFFILWSCWSRRLVSSAYLHLLPCLDFSLPWWS